MPAVRTLGASGVSLIRPLLEVTRAETAAWVALHGIAPVVDPSNASLRFARVRARRDLGAHEGLDRRLAGFAARAADHVERLDEAAAALGPLDGIDASRVASAGADVALRLLRRAGVHRAGHRHQEALLRLVANMSGTQHLDLGDGVWAERVYGRLSFGRGTLPPRPPAACVAVLVSGRYVVGDRAVRVSLEAVASSSTDGHPEEARTGDALDVDGLPADWVLRGIRAGDRLRTAGGRRKVQDLLVDRKVPRAARARLLVLAPGAGPDELLWVEGIGAAWDRRPHVATRRVLRLTVLTTNEDADGSE